MFGGVVSFDGHYDRQESYRAILGSIVISCISVSLIMCPEHGPQSDCFGPVATAWSPLRIVLVKAIKDDQMLPLLEEPAAVVGA